MRCGKPARATGPRRPAERPGWHGGVDRPPATYPAVNRHARPSRSSVDGPRRLRPRRRMHQPPRPSPPRSVRSRGDRRRSRLRAHRGVSPAPAPHPAARVFAPPRTARVAHRSRAGGRTRSGPASARASPGRARRAGTAQPLRPAPMHRPATRRPVSPGRQPGHAAPAVRDRQSARSPVPGTPRPPPLRRAPGRGWRIAPARSPRPHPVPARRAHGATPAGPGQLPDRSHRRVPGAPPAGRGAVAARYDAARTSG